jgi:transcriptional regulator with GAF, ATPase, and Fis domain
VRPLEWLGSFFSSAFWKVALNQLRNRRTWLALAGATALAYALAVLAYVRSSPTLGIKSAFSEEVTGQPRDVHPGPEGLLPQPGDQVVEVGDLRIATWPDLLLAPRRLQQRLEAQASWPEWAQPAGEDGVQVRVRFVREGEGGQPTQSFTAWCLLGPPHWDELFPSLLWFCLKLTLFTCGALLMWQRPQERAVAQFFVLCVVTLGAYMGGYHWPYLATAPLLLVGFMIYGVLLPPVSLHFYLVFPRTQAILERAPRRTLLAVYGLPLMVLAALLLLYFRIRWLFHHGGSAAAIEEAIAQFLAAIYVSLGVSALWYVASVLALVYSYRTITDRTERNQVKWILYGALGSLVPIGYSLALAIWWPGDFGAGAATWPMFVASALVTGAFMVSITRYRLLELDQIVSAGVTYFFLAGLVYYAIIFVGTLVLGQVIAGPRLSEAVRVSLTALVLLFCLDLARSRLRRALDRRFSREKYHLDRTLQRLGEAVQQLVDPPTLLQRLLQACAELLGVSRGAVYLGGNGGAAAQLAGVLGPVCPPAELPADSPLWQEAQRGPVIARLRLGTPPTPGQQQLAQLGGEVAQPLCQEGRLLALLLLGPRAHVPYRPEDLNLLAAFAQITALALASAEGHQTIDRLRQELADKVEKIAAQQRRILALQSQLRKQWARQATARSEPGAPTSPSTPSPPAPAAPAAVIAPLVPAGIVGSSPRIRQLVDMIRKVAATDAVVLIRGESGTGKELVAQAVHDASPRASKAFIKVHCAALSPTLLESELFGHVKGAFTGAISHKVGRFELANGGTLFLDEIGDVSLEVQTKLLRVLQEKTIERVGSSEPVKVDVRILAATHQNLEELIRQGRFREDLFYRLNVFPLWVPPLREHPEDIPELALYFLQRCAARCRKEVTQIDDDALCVLKSYSWPGNIRQLENVLERAVVLAEGPVLTVRELPPELVAAAERTGATPGRDGEALSSRAELPRLSRAERLQRERELILRALQACGGNKAEAARALGMARSTLVSRLKRYGLG